MAVRIPTYEDRLVPQGAGPSPVFRPAEQTDAIGRGLQNLGNAGLEFASVNYHLDQKRQLENDINKLGPELAKASVDWPERVATLAKTATGGANIAQADGSVMTLTDAVTSEFNSYRQQFLDTIKNEKVRNYASGQLDNVYAATLRHSVNTEGVLKGTFKADNINQTVSTYASGAATDLTVAEQNLTAAKALIANSGLDEHTRNQTALAATKSIVEAAIQGALKRDPSTTRAALLQRFGVTENQMGAPGATAAPATVDSVWPALTNLESGGKQLKPDGTPVTSVKGAIGIAQIMPGTGPEAAKLAGLPWNANKLKTDASYNEALGKAYLAKQLDTFGGDMSKALAAYNMGPGTAAKGNGVSGLVAKYGDQWLSHAPKETQDYVATITARMGKTTGTAAATPARQIPTQLATLVAQLETDRVPAFISEAQTEMNRTQATYKSQIATTENDHVAAFMNGAPVAKPLTEAQYVQAYGPVEGAQRYAQYQQIGAMGVDMNALKLQTPEQIQQTVAKYKPDPANTVGYDLANKRYAAVQEAANRVVTARNSDPMQYALDAAVAPVKTINWNEADKATAELKNRVGVAATMNGTYGAPYALLTKAEASNLAAGINVMSAPQKLAYFATMAKAIPNQDALESIMQQIAPDSPVSAVAGKLATMDAPNIAAKGTWYRSERAYNPQVVASMIMRGEELINPGKNAKGEDGKPHVKLLPKETDFDQQFNNRIGAAFSGQQRDAYNVAMQSVKAYYAAASEQASDYSGELNSSRLDTAIEAVTGGATDVNGSKVRRPWGMMEDTFMNQAKSVFDAKMAQLGRKGPDANFYMYGLENYRGGYRVREGTGYMRDNDGRQIVLDVTGQMTPPARPPVDPTKPVGPNAKPITQTPNTK